MSIGSFAALRQAIRAVAPPTLCIAGGDDPLFIETAREALSGGLVGSVLISGDAGRIAALCESAGLATGRVRILPASGAEEAAAVAVEAVRDRRADLLAKGNIDSAVYFRSILQPGSGLRRSPVLSNLTMFELPSYHKLLTITDNGIIPVPTLEQKLAIIGNTRPLFRALGIAPAKVAVVAASEKVNPHLPATLDAARLTRMNADGELQGFLVDGPFGYDACIDHDAAAVKGLGHSRVAGDPDLLLFANLEAANALGKALKFHGQAQSGGLVMGASCPVILNSRSDAPDRRLNSLVMAIAIMARTRDDDAATGDRPRAL